MKKYSELSFTTQKELLQDFCRILINLKTETEAVKFLTDLLTKEELIKLAKRIKIAQFLIDGREYRQIERALQVGHSTIAKVAQWLKEAGDGFRLVIKRAGQKQKTLSPETNFDLVLKGWKQFKGKYPSMFWPSFLVEGIIDSADKKQKDKMYDALQKLDKKSRIYKEVNSIFTRNH